MLDQKDVTVEFEILSVSERMGIAKRNANFTKISSGEHLTYEGIYQVFLDKAGKCTEFREWFNFKINENI